MIELQVKKAFAWYPEKNLEVIDQDYEKHIIPFEVKVHVKMNHVTMEDDRRHQWKGTCWQAS